MASRLLAEFSSLVLRPHPLFFQDTKGRKKRRFNPRGEKLSTKRTWTIDGEDEVYFNELEKILGSMNDSNSTNDGRNHIEVTASVCDKLKLQLQLALKLFHARISPIKRSLETRFLSQQDHLHALKSTQS
jgi:hypothetical protein